MKARVTSWRRQVAQAAQSASDRSLTLLAQAERGHYRERASSRRGRWPPIGVELAQEADSPRSEVALRGVPRFNAQRRCSGSAIRRTALREAERALARAEALGLKVPLAKAHYLKASVLRAKGDPAARRDYAAALRLLEEVKGDGGNENVLKRADLAAMHAECAKWSKEG